MFDSDHSAARGMMSARKLILFKHNSELGCAPASELFDLVKITKNTDGPVRSFSDYDIEIDKGKCPAGVEIEEIL